MIKVILIGMPGLLFVLLNFFGAEKIHTMISSMAELTND